MKKVRLTIIALVGLTLEAMAREQGKQGKQGNHKACPENALDHTEKYGSAITWSSSNTADAQKVSMEIAALEIKYSGTDSAGHVTSKVTLPEVGVNGSTIVWYSSSTAVIANIGTVIRPQAGTNDKTVILTAALVNNAFVDTKAFTVIVKQLP